MHYVFCQNGLLGSRVDFQTLVDHFQASLTTKIVPLVSNEGIWKTLGGVELAGSRCCEEIRTHVAQWHDGVSVSVVGHSMGGLILRHALRELVISDPEFWLRHKISLRVAIFVATPHTGVPRRMPFVQTGSDLVLKSPILLQLSDEYGQKSLNEFEKGVVLYGNVARDKFVPLESALICEKVEANRDTYQAGVMTITPHETNNDPVAPLHAADAAFIIRQNLNSGIKQMRRFLVDSPPAWPKCLQVFDNSAHTRIIAHGQMDRARIGMPMIQHLENLLMK